MDQLTAVDSLFLDLEDENTQMNIGGVSVLEGPAPHFADLQRVVLGRLDCSPRYRQRLMRLPVGLGRPIWVDDEEFDLDNHFSEVDLGSSVSFEDVCDYFGSQQAEKFDRARPLWRIEIVKNLPAGQWAILWSVHHAVVDGIAATDLLALLLSPDRETKPAPGQEWVPRPAPVASEIVARAASGEIGPLRLARGLRGAVREPSRSLGQLREAASGLAPLGRSLLEPRREHISCPINGPIGPTRIWRVTELDLAAVKRVARANNGTVNDIVLVAVTDGIRESLAAHGDDLGRHRIRTMVPVNVRKEDDAHLATNRVSAVFVDLPVGVDDPAGRVAAIRAQMDKVKERQSEQTARVLGRVADFVPKELFGLGERGIVRVADVARFFNTITTNVPGPQFPLYCLGRKMTALYPYVMLAPDLRVATAVFSYDGRVYFGITGDAGALLDIERVCEGISSSLERMEWGGRQPTLTLVDTLAA